MDKLEKHIKDKLEERTIAPSASAWDKIASQVKQSSPNKKNIWFPYAIAASVVGIVMVSIFFFTQDNPEVQQIQVVETETKTEIETRSQDETVKGIVLEEQTKVAETKSGPITLETKEELSSKEPISNTAVAEQDMKQPLQDEVRIHSDKLIAQKVEEVMAQVELMEITQQDVSDAEVDSLLRAAQQQILTDKLFSESGSVDAMSLLAEVEDEMDESFRDQIFDALKTGYLKLRTAVADRNQ